MLSAITFLPVLGAIIILFLPNDRAIKTFSIFWTIPPLILSIIAWVVYPTWRGFMYNACGSDAVGQAIAQASGQFYLGECLPWIPGLGVSYHLGADGISIPLIFLTTLLTTVSVYYSARTINTRVREFFSSFSCSRPACSASFRRSTFSCSMSFGKSGWCRCTS